MISTLFHPGVEYRVTDRSTSFPYQATDWMAHAECTSRFYQLYVKGFDSPRWSTALGLVPAKWATSLEWPSWVTVDTFERSIILDGDSVLDRSEKFNSLLPQLRFKGSEPLNLPWSGQMVPMFSRSGQHLMDVDGSAAALLGIPLYTVNIMALTFVDGTPYWSMSKRADDAEGGPG